MIYYLREIPMPLDIILNKDRNGFDISNRGATLKDDDWAHMPDVIKHLAEAQAQKALISAIHALREKAQSPSPKLSSFFPSDHQPNLFEIEASDSSKKISFFLKIGSSAPQEPRSSLYEQSVRNIFDELIEEIQNNHKTPASSSGFTPI
jgi:hypothetical protein